VAGIEIRLCDAEAQWRPKWTTEKVVCREGIIAGGGRSIEIGGSAVEMQGTQLNSIALIKFYLGDISNDITMTAFRLLVSDLLALFQPLNEGVMNVLGIPVSDVADFRSLL